MTGGNEQIYCPESRQEQVSSTEIISVPENLRRELVGERFFLVAETAAQETIKAGKEQGFVSGFRFRDYAISEVATSEIIEGDERNVLLDIARLQLEDNRDVVSLLFLHTHVVRSAIKLSDDDVQKWERNQATQVGVIPGTGENVPVKVTNRRPVEMTLFPDPEDISQSRLIVLAQTPEAKTELGVAALVKQIAFSGDLSQREESIRLRRILEKQGVRVRHFTLGQRKEIQQFILEHLPKKLILEEAGIPKPFGGPDLSFLGKGKSSE